MDRSYQDYKDPSEYSDEQLLGAYKQAKFFGPQQRLDELQLEIAQRWEQQQ
jgi:hypothetical protein